MKSISILDYIESNILSLETDKQFFSEQQFQRFRE